MWQILKAYLAENPKHLFFADGGYYAAFSKARVAEILHDSEVKSSTKAVGSVVRSSTGGSLVDNAVAVSRASFATDLAPVDIKLYRIPPDAYFELLCTESLGAI